MVNQTILVAVNSDLNYDQRMQRICTSISKLGYKVFILGRSFKNSIPLGTEAYGQERISLWFQKGKPGYIELNLRLFWGLLFKKGDAIYSVDLDTLPACWLLSKIKGLMLIHDAHEYMEEVPEVYNRLLTKKIWRFIGKTFVPQTDLAFTTSQSIADVFQKIYNTEFGLIRNIAQLKEDESPNPTLEKQGFWVFLGAVNQGRGIEEFLQILPYTNRKLVILGDGDRLSAIKKMVSEKQLDHLVDFRGKVKPDEARQILKQAWAGINLLTDEGLSYRYSLANKFFDYVHAEIPQICINFPEYKLLMEEFEVGVLCSLKAESILAASQIVSMPEKQSHFRKQAKEAKRVWNWQEESKKLEKMLEGLFMK